MALILNFLYFEGCLGKPEDFRIQRMQPMLSKPIKPKLYEKTEIHYIHTL